MSKSIGQIAYEGDGAIGWESNCKEMQRRWQEDAKVVLAHAAQLLREQGEREPTYALQDAFNRAAKILEELE